MQLTIKGGLHSFAFIENYRWRSVF